MRGVNCEGAAVVRGGAGVTHGASKLVSAQSGPTHSLYSPVAASSGGATRIRLPLQKSDRSASPPSSASWQHCAGLHPPCPVSTAGAPGLPTGGRDRGVDAAVPGEPSGGGGDVGDGGSDMAVGADGAAGSAVWGARRESVGHSALVHDGRRTVLELCGRAS